jgi:hypothetical protein
VDGGRSEMCSTTPPADPVCSWLMSIDKARPEPRIEDCLSNDSVSG